MPPVKPIAAAAMKWRNNASNAGAMYEVGVKNPRVNQADAARAANDTWKAAIQQAVTRDAFSKGIAAAGAEKWARGSIEKGITRYPQGVTVSEPIYQSATAKYFDVIANTTLPPRGPTGDPRNLQRVVTMANALRAAKTGTR